MNKNWKQMLQAFVSDESGQDMIEYALVAALIGLGAVASLRTVATAITGAFTNINTQLGTAV